MTALFYGVAIILVVLIVGVYVSWRAGRLDRLHARTDAARTALDLALVRRSSSAYELASSGLLDPATSVLLGDAVRRTKEGDQPRDLAESDLTRALRAAFSQEDLLVSLKDNDGAEELVGELAAAAHQVFLARKFYNDVALRAIDARRRPLARAFRLAGNAPQPEFFDMDDALADADGRR